MGTPIYLCALPPESPAIPGLIAIPEMNMLIPAERPPAPAGARVHTGKPAKNTLLKYSMPDLSQEDFFMRIALREAQAAIEAGDVPVGAVIVRGKTVIARAHNQTELLRDPTAHAEMIAITQAASAVGDWRLTDCDLYVTKEPCPMCAGAIALARIPRVFFGAPDPQNPGLVKSAEVRGGVLGEECKAMLQEFFKNLRARQRAAGRPAD